MAKEQPYDHDGPPQSIGPDTAEGFLGPSPNPKTNLMIASIVLRGGSMLMRRTLERGLLGAKYTPKKAQQIIKSRNLTDTLIGTAVAKLATRSVPGALLVGGGLLAKTLSDRRRGKLAALKGEAEMHEMAAKGEKREG